jgi:hypothetical protein
MTAISPGHAGQQRLGLDGLDAGLGMGVVGQDRHLPAEPRTRLAAHRLQRHGQQAAGHLLAAGDDHVIFGGIVERMGLAAEVDQAVGLARHGRDDHRHLMPGFLLAFDDARHAPNTLGPGHGGATEFHHDAGHKQAPINWLA